MATRPGASGRRAGELLDSRVTASGVNRLDVPSAGHYPVPPGASDIYQSPAPSAGDASPRREAGPPWAIGCALVAGGGYEAELCAWRLCARRFRAGCRIVEAASLPETFFTVWEQRVSDRGRLQPGETLLIQGGSSGQRDPGREAKALGAR